MLLYEYESNMDIKYITYAVKIQIIKLPIC